MWFFQFDSLSKLELVVLWFSNIDDMIRTNNYWKNQKVFQHWNIHQISTQKIQFWLHIKEFSMFSWIQRWVRIMSIAFLYKCMLPHTCHTSSFSFIYGKRDGYGTFVWYYTKTTQYKPSTTLCWIFGDSLMIGDKCLKIRVVNKCWIHGY